MKEKIPVALIGAGPRGNCLAITALKAGEIDLTAVCEPNPQHQNLFLEECEEQGVRNRFEAKFYTTLEKCLEHSPLEAVIVATPAPMHAEHSTACLKAGYHVISEVPAVYTMDEAKELVSTVRESRGKYFFAENACYMYYLRKWKEYVHNGKIGEPQYVEGEYIHGLRDIMTFSKDCWRTKLDPIRYSTHETGPLLEILNDRVVEVTAMTTSNKVYLDQGKLADDLQVSLFRTEKGVTFKQLNGFAVNRHCMGTDHGLPVYHYYSLYGSRGFMETTRHGEFGTLAVFSDREDKKTRHLDWSIINPDLPKETHDGHGTADWEMLEDFFSCIREDRPPPIDVFRGLDFTLPGIMAIESIKKNSTLLKVPDPRTW